MNKSISLELLNKILAYLGNRPYIEVKQLIDEIFQLKDVETNAKKS